MNAAELCERLLNVRDRYGRHALHNITDPEKVRVLMKYNEAEYREADGGVNVNVLDMYNKTPLDYAIETERPNVVAVIKEYGGRRGSEIQSHTTQQRTHSLWWYSGVAAVTALLTMALLVAMTNKGRSERRQR